MRTRWRWVAGGLLLAAALALLRWWQLARLEASQDPAILAAARRYRVDAALVKAVVWRESRFDPLARGGKGEIGLMQIMKDTGQEWAAAEKVPLFYPERLFDPALNTEAGAWYLQKLLRRYRHTDNPIPYALADYNAGRGNVLRWARGAAATNSQVFLTQITYPGTRDYVKSVIRRYEKYRRTFPPDPNALPARVGFLFKSLMFARIFSEAGRATNAKEAKEGNLLAGPSLPPRPSRGTVLSCGGAALRSPSSVLQPRWLRCRAGNLQHVALFLRA